MSLPLDPSVLFFIAGLLSATAAPWLRFPMGVSALLSRFLLAVVGVKGGLALSDSGLNGDVALTVIAGLLLALAIPALGFPVLQRLTTRLNAAAIAAAYGSVSVVTFVTATSALDVKGSEYGGHMAAVMALMESPAIFMAIILAASVRSRRNAQRDTLPLGRAVREAVLDRTQMLLLAAFAVGLFIGEPGGRALSPLTETGFQFVLALFLLDMGGEVARQLPVARHASPGLLAYAVCGPLAHASLALAMSALLGLSAGDATLLMVLSASASYIVVPAVIRHAIPEANPALYLGLSLGVTFPFNIILGIPLYTQIAHMLL